MFRKNLLLGTSLGFLALVSAVGTAQATDVDVDASITTRAAISLTKNTDMAFGNVDYAATHGGSIQLGTDGSVGLSGATGLTLSGGTTTAGDIDVSGDGASVVEISCETGGVLAETGGNTLTLSAVEYTTGAGTTPGGATACAGLGTTPSTVDLSSTVLMGGTIDVTGNAIAASGTYTTTDTGNGGDPVTLRVVYQ